MKDLPNMNIVYLSLAAAIAATSASATPVLFSQTFNPVIVVDAGEASGALTVDRSGIVTDLDLIVDVSGAGSDIASDGTPMGGGNAYFNELALTLVSPTGTSVNVLASGTYASGPTDLRFSLTLDDEASSVFGPEPETGTFRPTNLLSSFDGENAFGAWSLFVIDTTGGDPKSLNGFTLRIAADEFDAPSAVPVPAALPLLIGGIGVLGWAARRRG